MNYNLKNKVLFATALLFVVAIAANRACFAADEPSLSTAPVAETVETAAAATADATLEQTQKAAENIEALSAEEKAAVDSLKELDSEIAAVKEELQAINSDLDTSSKDNANISASIDEDLAFLENDGPNELDELKDSPKDKAQSPDNTTENAASGGENNAENEAPNVEAPKSPLESFGNSILSKVDNSLFNKMSTIEKQTTLLRLEYKREELKNKVAALRTARLRAMEEEVERRRAYEEKLKNAEAERQAKILEEQRKLKEREMELEKLRQAKVLNDYMNEMLMMNQKWVEKNAKLQNRIHELEDERVELINDFKGKIDSFKTILEKTQKHVNLAVKEHFVTINTLRNKISELEQVIADKEEQIRALKVAAENPFGDGTSQGGPSQADIDLSQQYAIMDITGQGDEIVAKLVTPDGKTFTVHKGSMLKGGEVVSAITDTYISFDNRGGAKSYLYTGGSIREYEPEATFKDSSEDFFAPLPIPEKEAAPAGGKAEENAKSSEAKSAAPNNAAPNAAPQAAPKSGSPAPSPTRGMFVK